MIGMGPVVAFYFTWHMRTSPISRPQEARKVSPLISVPIPELQALPYSVILGFILPTIPWLLPTPSVISPGVMQFALLFWQPFHLYIVGSQRLIINTFGTGETVNSSGHSKSYISEVPKVYRFILGLCLLSQISTILYIIFASDMSIMEIFWPANPSIHWKMSSISNGTHVFLIWDFYTSAVSSLIWAFSLLQLATATTSTARFSWKESLAKSVIWTILGGPFAATTVLLWDRDRVLSLGSPRS